jgi:hypothetical protein
MSTPKIRQPLLLQAIEAFLEGLLLSPRERAWRQEDRAAAARGAANAVTDWVRAETGHAAREEKGK